MKFASGFVSNSSSSATVMLLPDELPPQQAILVALCDALGVEPEATEDKEYPKLETLHGAVKDVKRVVCPKKKRIGDRNDGELPWDLGHPHVVAELLPHIVSFSVDQCDGCNYATLDHYGALETLLGTYKPTYWYPAFQHRAPKKMADACWTFLLCSHRPESPVSKLDLEVIQRILSFTKTSDWLPKLN